MRIATRKIESVADLPFRPLELADAQALAVLMDEAYRGTIDHEGETPEQCLEEMTGTLTGKYGPFLGFASFGIFEEGQAVSVSIVTLWKEKPLLAWSMTHPRAQGKGYAKFLIERSIDALARNGYPEVWLVVTDGNVSAEHLYRKIGFQLIGPPPTGAAHST
jgi:ribosomal protein S18 acetylase RimI-like enzyme